jgi:hypothetical protein
MIKNNERTILVTGATGTGAKCSRWYYSLLEGRWSIFEQFEISRGLYYGKQKLQFILDSVRIAYDGLRLVDNLAPDRFDDEIN